jgi:hypothetical protein
MRMQHSRDSSTHTPGGIMRIWTILEPTTITIERESTVKSLERAVHVELLCDKAAAINIL